VRLGLERYRTADNSLPTKHVVVAGLFARDAGSTPAASTFFLPIGNFDESKKFPMGDFHEFISGCLLSGGFQGLLKLAPQISPGKVDSAERC
jgi:hypothetical protein